MNDGRIFLDYWQELHDERKSGKGGTLKAPAAIQPWRSRTSTRKLNSPRELLRRMLWAIGVWCALTLCGLIIGMAGYCYFDHMSLSTFT